MRLFLSLLAFGLLLFFLHHLVNRFPLEYYEEVKSVAERFGFDPLLIMSMIKVESDFDPNAVSPVGAIGLMQIMPETSRWMAEKFKIEIDITTPSSNIEAGAMYLNYLLKRYGDILEALKAYNVGPHAHESGSREGAAERYLRKTLWTYRIYRFLYRPPR